MGRGSKRQRHFACASSGQLVAADRAIKIQIELRPLAQNSQINHADNRQITEEFDLQFVQLPPFAQKKPPPTRFSKRP